MTKKSIDEQIEELENQIASLQTQKAKLKALTPVQELAIFLHQKTCHWNHTDGCDWFYYMKDDMPTWEGHAQQDALKKAQRAMFHVIQAADDNFHDKVNNEFVVALVKAAHDYE